MADFKEGVVNVRSFNIEFYNSDGFLVYEFEITSWKEIINSNNERAGMQSANSVDFLRPLLLYASFYEYKVSVRGEIPD